MATKPTSDETFEADVLEAGRPVLVDFWAEWCAPCKQIAPALEDIATERTDSLTVAKMDIDDNPETPTRYGVRSIPTLILFKDGQAAAITMGAKSKTALNAWLDEALNA